jgi:segregation and condensation protein B
MTDHDDDEEGGKPEGEASDTEPPAAEPSMGPGEVNLDEEEEGDEAATGPGLHGSVAMALEDLPGALEALILVSDKPIPAVRLARLTRQDIGMVRQKLAELQGAYAGRGLVLDEIAGGYQFRTSARYAPFVRNLVQQKPVKLTRAQLEVLAIIAYRQPVTRPEVEDVRGVDSGSALKVLLERGVIKIIGKRDDAGLPQGAAMNLETHYEAAPDREIPEDDEEPAQGEGQGEEEPRNTVPDPEPRGTNPEEA